MQKIVEFKNTNKKGKTVRAKEKGPLTRLEKLTPLVWREIQYRYADAEYFTRDHILYFTTMRQFSISYRIQLTRFVCESLIKDNKILKFNTTDFAINTIENNKRYRAVMKNPTTTYAGSFTTRAADELLNKETRELFDIPYLEGWLACVAHLA